MLSVSPVALVDLLLFSNAGRSIEWRLSASRTIGDGENVQAISNKSVAVLPSFLGGMISIGNL